MCVWSSHINSEVWINRVRLPILLVVSWTGKMTIISLSPCVPENLISRDVLILHTQKAESGAYLRGFSRVPRRRPFIYIKQPYAIGPVPSLSGYTIAYRWRSLPLPRVHLNQGSFERVLPWQVTMDQLISASLSHTHYWYEVKYQVVRNIGYKKRGCATIIIRGRISTTVNEKKGNGINGTS